MNTQRLTRRHLNELLDLVKWNEIESKVSLELVLRLLAPIRIDTGQLPCWFRRDDWSDYSTVDKIPAHRLSYWIFTGIEPPSNMMVCHHCDRKGCINSNHLFLGNASINHHDAIVKRRKWSSNKQYTKSKEILKNFGNQFRKNVKPLTEDEKILFATIDKEYSIPGEIECHLDLSDLKNLK